MPDSRSPIPAEIRRRVLVEAGHRCAIPTCRYIEVDVHHIIPWSDCQAHEYDNLICLCPNCHRRAGKGEIDRKSLRLYKLNLRFTHDKFSQVEVDVLFELGKLQPNQAIVWPPHSLILLKRLLDASFINPLQSETSRFFINEFEVTPYNIFLTNKGRAFINEIGIHEL